MARATLEPLPGLLFAPLRIRYYFRINSNSKKDPVHIDRLSDFNPRGPGSNFSVNRTRIIPLFFPLVFSPSLFFFSLSLSFDGTTTIGEERTSMEQRSSSEIFLKGSLKKKKKKRRSCLPRFFEIVLVHFSLRVSLVRLVVVGERMAILFFFFLRRFNDNYGKLIERKKKGGAFLRCTNNLEGNEIYIDLTVILDYFYLISIFDFYTRIYEKTKGRTNKKKEKKERKGNHPADFRYLIFLYLLRSLHFA